MKTRWIGTYERSRARACLAISRLVWPVTPMVNILCDQIDANYWDIEGIRRGLIDSLRRSPARAAMLAAGTSMSRALHRYGLRLREKG